MLVLILAVTGGGGSNNSAPSAMNANENLTTTDMNVTSVDMNASAPEANHRTKTTSLTSSPEASEHAAPAEIAAYDTEAYCRKIGDTAGGSYEIEETCRDEESKALSQLNSRSIPERTLEYCSRIGDTAGGSYEIMETCVEQELDSASRL